MARQSEEDEIETLLTALVAATAEAFSPLDEDRAREGLLPTAQAVVRWVRARETDDLEVDLSGVQVSGTDLVGTGTIT